ncbi:poly(glycerol-phosphate) alpha-glucosyltransferase [Paramicrobacterium humi]|uniref:Poly(Glycerol-phosphate) alpha-glucosyltransferase n=2 Tax=Paramicrobacterium humi TaxID=640635 RepID=A0A1H4QG89_9MICO|nr:poly(glycerol-phosphate) alpha-glucosyltransferase [Microbacterium humi]
MTAAMLHRSRAFVTEAGADVTVLTLDDRPDYAVLEDRLRADGTIVDGIRILNLWDWLSEAHVRHAARHVPAATALEDDESDAVRTHDGVTRSRTRTSDGRTVAVDRFRPDGSLLLTDRQENGDRHLVLYGRDGEPVRFWKSTWALYRYWLDQLTASRRSFLVVDSKTAARFVHSYRREHVVTLHVLHGSHRRRGSAQSVSDSRRETFEHAGDYDAIVTLTRRQADDYLADGASPKALFVVPNGRAERETTSKTAHVRGRGVMLASLTKRKRITHAIDALALVRRGGADVTLDLFGEGPEHEALAQRIVDRELTDTVRLRGFERDADVHFADADFTLLTSTSEGLPLVLAESMAAGCIPIAYDICYGPADIIQNGRNGFLVPEGDIEQLAERITQLQRMPPRAVSELRRRARATARRFGDAAVTRRWGRAMELALEGKRESDAGESAMLRLRHRAGRFKRRVQRVLGA